MRKVVCYCATHSHYRFLPVTVWSLQRHTDVDRIICFVESDGLPPMKGVEYVNYKKLEHQFKETSPNWNSSFTYMASVRLEFPKLVNEEQILYLDTDTVVCDDISPLWDIDLTDYAVAGVAENWSLRREIRVGEYINSGVLMMNLTYIRKHHLGEKFIKEINSTEYNFPDQDIINLVCHGKIKYIDREYNEFFATQMTEHPKIVHYAGEKRWWTVRNPRNGYWNENRVDNPYKGLTWVLRSTLG